MPLTTNLMPRAISPAQFIAAAEMQAGHASRAAARAHE